LSRRLPDDIHPEWRPSGRGVLAAICRTLLHAMGWRLVLTIPWIERAVIVFYPHTSNWDFVIGLLARFALGIPVTWAGKDNLFRGPFVPLWTAMGGIPVNRREHTGFVAQMTRAFAERPRMLLAIAPEGTRKRTTHWKSGAYRVALAAKVPIAMSFIDFARREVGVGGLMQPSGDPDRDFAALRAFYEKKTGRHPSQASPIVLEARPVTSSTAARAEQGEPVEREERAGSAGSPAPSRDT
jgi:1-acyl-sn-glycerol-3-phosphate acyltransferase